MKVQVIRSKPRSAALVIGKHGRIRYNSIGFEELGFASLLNAVKCELEK